MRKLLVLALVLLPALASAQITVTSPGIDLGAHVWTGQQTAPDFLVSGAQGGYTLGGSAAGGIYYGTVQTPDAFFLAAGSLSNGVVVAEVGDVSFDFAHPQQTNPTLFVENAAQDTTQHTGIAYYGTQGRAIKTLTESAATSAFRVPVAALTGVGGTVSFTVFAADATDVQTLTGVLQYAAVNKAATETCATPTLTGTALNSVSTGTLTCTYACDTSPANAVDIQFNCVSSLTQTTLEVWYRVTAIGASEPLPQ